MKKLLSLAALFFAALSINAQDPIAVTCAEAAAAMPETNQATTEETYIVTGYITETNGTISREQQCFWMDDEKGSKKTVQGYWCNLPEGEKDKALKVGDKITVTGKIMNYNNTPEIKNGDVAIIERAEVLPVDTITVSDAIQRIKDGKLQACAVSGKVMEPFINTKAGNAVCYWMTDVNNPNDSIQAFKMNGADDQKYNDLSDLEFIEGDVILVYAKGLSLYHDNGKNIDIPEINGGYFIEKISGSEDINLAWPDAVAYAYSEEDHWSLEIQKVSEDEQNKIEVSFPLEKADAIAGSYTIANNAKITVGGVSEDAASGTLLIEFKAVDKDKQNVYSVAIKAIADGKIYHFNQEIVVVAIDAEYETIDLVGDRPFTPTEDGQEITCAQAREYCLSLEANATSEYTVVVTGYVTQIVENFNNTFWMDDQKGSAKTIEAFKYSSVLPVGSVVTKDAKVKVTGKLTHYVSNSGYSTPEFAAGCSVEVLSGTQIQEVTVAQAIEIGNALNRGATSSDFYKITGYITNIVEGYSEQYKNVTFWMSDTEGDEAQTFEAYRISCDASIADKIVEGAQVIVTAQIQHFYKEATADKDELEVIEAVNGTVVIAGTGVEEIYTTVPASKFIYDGQLYIIRGNALYNVQGQLVK